jgi:hypothetical protein
MRRISLVVGILILVAACAAGSRQTVLNQQGGKGIPNTTECVSKNPDGTCNKKTCKADAESDCAEFAYYCIKNDDGYYQGTKESGTCSRVL